MHEERHTKFRHTIVLTDALVLIGVQVHGGGNGGGHRELEEQGHGGGHEEEEQEHGSNNHVRKSVLSNTSAVYTLSVYPSDEYFEAYRTDSPVFATVGSVCIIIFTALLFFLYNFCVRREFSHMKDLLEAKRKFVRFVSHEVRTPLYSVCLGLTLMQEQLVVASLGNKSVQGDVGSREVPPNATKKGEVNKREAEWLELTGDILSNAQSSVTVLSDLLNYDKIEMGALSLELTVIPIWQLVERTVSEFTVSAAQKKINLEIGFSQPPEEGTDAEMSSHPFAVSQLEFFVVVVSQ